MRLFGQTGDVVEQGKFRRYAAPQQRRTADIETNFLFRFVKRSDTVGKVARPA